LINTVRPHRSPNDASEARDAKFDALLETVGEGNKHNIEKHLAACSQEPAPEHTDLWKRLFCMLHKLAGHAIKTTGQRAVQFFVADGRYRIQAFALEDPRDHTLIIYASDVLAAALESELLSEMADVNGDENLYAVDGERTAHLRIERLTQAASGGPDFYRHMLGWNRKAMKITMPISAGPATVRAAEALCALAAIPAKPRPAE
jgi:hypothetical protein